MSDRCWNTHVLFANPISTVEIIESCYQWILDTNLQVVGFCREPFDPQTIDDFDPEYETQFTQSLGDIKSGLLHHPGLGDIMARWPIPGKDYSAIFYILLRDTTGDPHTLDYLTFIIEFREYLQLDSAVKRSILRYHIDVLGNIPSLLWITMGHERDYFPNELEDAATVEAWRKGQELIPLDYTWIRHDLFEHMRSNPDMDMPADPLVSSLLKDEKGTPFVRLHEHEPIWQGVDDDRLQD